MSDDSYDDTQSKQIQQMTGGRFDEYCAMRSAGAENTSKFVTQVSAVEEEIESAEDEQKQNTENSRNSPKCDKRCLHFHDAQLPLQKRTLVHHLIIEWGYYIMNHCISQCTRLQASGVIITACR